MVDNLLPQTQCERCGYKGCKPYAEAVVRDNEAINLCQPGGQITTDLIAKNLGKKTIPVTVSPQHYVAVINEDNCIGCTKCIQACPVDAIVGASQMMHTIIESDCTGCELCLPPCPTHCIDIVSKNEEPYHPIKQASQGKATYFKQRFIARKERLAKQLANKSRQTQKKKQVDFKAEIQASLNRVQQKRALANESTNTSRDI